MLCPNCGNNNHENAKFCSRCGQTLLPQEVAPPDPAIHTKKVKLEMNPNKIFTKENGINFALWLFLGGIYVCISLIFIFVFNMSDTISVNSAYNDSYVTSITLQEYLKLLSEGNRMFNPTPLSTALSLAVNIFFYSVPVFAGIALLTSIFSKKNMAFHTASAVISGISALMLMLIIPMSIMFVPQINAALGIKLGLLAEDIKKITYTPLIIHAIAVIVFIVISLIVATIYNRRRKKCIANNQ